MDIYIFLPIILRIVSDQMGRTSISKSKQKIQGKKQHGNNCKECNPTCFTLIINHSRKKDVFSSNFLCVM